MGSKLAKLAVGALEDLKGQDIKVLDVTKLTPITDWMVICTGTSNRHVKSLAASVVEKAKHSGHQPSGVEGMEMGEWVLVDLGEVVVHIMQLQSRAFYQLEKLWDMHPLAGESATKPAKPKRAQSTRSALPARSAKPKKPAAKKTAGVRKKTTARKVTAKKKS